LTLFEFRDRIDDGSIRCAWEAFICGDNAGPRVRGSVLNSWQRSRNHHISIHRETTSTLSEGELHRRRQRSARLFGAARKTLGQAAQLLEGTECMLMLTDASGVVLETVGDARTVARGDEIGLQRGGLWAEADIGTNAIGTALVADAPVQVHGFEHFCSNVQRWTCAAAPVHHPLSGQTLGVIDLSGPPQTFSPQNLAWVIALAQQIEAALRHEIDVENTEILRYFLTRRGHWHHDGLLALGHGGRIVHATETALKQLHRADRYLIGDGRIAALDGHEPSDWRGPLHAILPEAEFEPVTQRGQQIGAVIILPQRHTLQESNTPHRNQRPPPAVTTERREASPFAAIIGESASLRQACESAQQMAASGAPILIEGETGVGKELFSRAIHSQWAPDGPFVPVNCGGMPRELIGSELFGYARGAFTGADSHGKPGKIEAAEGGTLCLDEIGEMPLELQPWLLRVLEDGIVYRIGSHHPHPVNLRLLSSTHRDLSQSCAEGRFRHDLFYRLAVLRLNIPPLRERGDDALLLAEHFARKAAERSGKTPPRFTPAALDLLRAHPWPGNVRELRNVVEMLVVLAQGHQIDAMHLSAALSQHSVPAVPIPLQGQDLRDLQQRAITTALRESGGNIAKAARTLGIARSTLYARLARR